MLAGSGALLGAAGGRGVAPMIPPSYRAAAQVEFVQAPGTAPLSDAARDARIDGFVETARALPVGTAALQGGGLRDDPELARDALVLGNGDQALAIALLDRVRPERVGATTLIRIEATSADPARAARYADALAKALIARSLADRMTDISPPDALLDRDLTASRLAAERADVALAAFRANNADSATQGDALVDQLRGALATARGDEAAAAARASSAGGSVVVSASTIGQNGTASLAQLRTQRAELARRVAQLGDRFDPAYPPLTSARVELGVLDSAIAAELHSLSRSARAEATAATSRAAALDRGLASAEQRRARTIGAGAEIAGLQRNSDTAREAYRQLQASLVQRATDRSIARPELRLAAPAAPPLRPSSPDRLLLSLFGALALGIAGALTGLWLQRPRLDAPAVLFAV